MVHPIIAFIIIVFIVIVVISSLIHTGEINNILSIPDQFDQSLKGVNEPINQACMIDDIILSQVYDDIHNDDKIKLIYEKISNNEHTNCDVKKLLKYLDPESRKKIGLDIICDFSDCT